MNTFNKQFVIEKVMKEYSKKTGKIIPVKSVTYSIKNDASNKFSVIIIVLNPIPTGGIIGFSIYFGEKNKLMIYDFNGDIISVHNDMIFKPVVKRKKLGKL